jgi:hypothetical protein
MNVYACKNCNHICIVLYTREAAAEREEQEEHLRERDALVMPYYEAMKNARQLTVDRRRERWD